MALAVVVLSLLLTAEVAPLLAPFLAQSSIEVASILVRFGLVK